VTENKNQITKAINKSLGVKEQEKGVDYSSK